MINKKFRLQTKSLFLTYPKCTLDRQIAYNHLFTLLDPERLLVVNELHKDGEPHLHVYALLKSPIDTSNCRFADLPGGYHGHYLGCRSDIAVGKYCTKTGTPNYIANYEVKIRVPKVSRAEHMESVLLGKRTLEELVSDEPQYLFNYASLTNSLKMYKEQTSYPTEPLPKWLPNPWGKLLPIYSEGKKRRHYHIFSSGPNAGKTTWANSVCEQYGGVIVSNKEPYWNLGPSVRFIFLDEYNTARFRYDELNAMADGTYGYRRCGSGVYQFARGSRPIIIVLSNQRLCDLYPFMFNLVDARYKFIDVSSFKYE